MPARLWPKPFDYLQQAKAFLITLCVILALLITSLFIMIYSRTNRLILQRVRQQAVDYIDLLEHTRQWNLNYGGVYVEKRPGVESNVYLEGLGFDPDIRAANGKVFTARNHAIMAAEISRISEKHDGIKFRVTSLKPLDPRNVPDTLEQSALQKFQKGTQEVYTLDEANPPALFRYMVPVYAEESCLECHFSQGYRPGDVIGAISVTLPVETVLKEQRTNKGLIILGALTSVGVFISVCYFLTWRLVRRLDQTQHNLKLQAATDDLTGLKNRRRIMARLEEEYQRAQRLGEPLCVIIIDIDHFKNVNDTYGHHAGDIVLKAVSSRMQETVRKYDSVGRIGGEEFLVIAPGTQIEDAVALAERVRKEIGEEPLTEGVPAIRATVSAGIAILDECDDTIESLLRRADTALYKAKGNGRNRVEVV